MQTRTKREKTMVKRRRESTEVVRRGASLVMWFCARDHRFRRRVARLPCRNCRFCMLQGKATLGRRRGTKEALLFLVSQCALLSAVLLLTMGTRRYEVEAADL